MKASREVIFFHSPNTRSSCALSLLEELHADYQLRVLNMKAGEQRGADYLAVNPMGKVPALLHNGVLITEQVAIHIYLADLYSEAGLAPAIGDPQRGAYLRWLVFYAACFEPAVVDRSQKREPTPPMMCPYGDYDTMLKTLTDQLAKGDYLLGSRFTAADLLWGNALTWATAFELVAKTPLIQAYIDRINARPSVKKVGEMDTRIVAEQTAA
jgi:glutathione S-transferase